MKTFTHFSAAIYAIGVLFTFGPAYNLDYDSTPRRYISVTEANLVPAIGSAFFWPFYWSAKLTTHLRKQ